MALGAQYVLELKFLDYDDELIDHDSIISLLHTLINDAMESINDVSGQQVALGEIMYETDYPIEDEE